MYSSRGLSACLSNSRKVQEHQETALEVHWAVAIWPLLITCRTMTCITLTFCGVYTTSHQPELVVTFLSTKIIDFPHVIYGLWLSFFTLIIGWTMGLWRPMMISNTLVNPLNHGLYPYPLGVWVWRVQVWCHSARPVPYPYGTLRFPYIELPLIMYLVVQGLQGLQGLNPFAISHLRSLNKFSMLQGAEFQQVHLNDDSYHPSTCQKSQNFSLQTQGQEI